jgi:hypothetical protein
LSALVGHVNPFSILGFEALFFGAILRYSARHKLSMTMIVTLTSIYPVTTVGVVYLYYDRTLALSQRIGILLIIHRYGCGKMELAGSTAAPTRPYWFFLTRPPFIVDGEADEASQSTRFQGTLVRLHY